MEGSMWLLFNATVDARAAIEGLCMILKMDTSAPMRNASILRISTATRESTPYAASDLAVSTSASAIMKISTSLFVMPLRTISVAFLKDEAAARRPLNSPDPSLTALGALELVSRDLKDVNL